VGEYPPIRHIDTCIFNKQAGSFFSRMSLDSLAKITAPLSSNTGEFLNYLQEDDILKMAMLRKKGKDK